MRIDAERSMVMGAGEQVYRSGDYPPHRGEHPSAFFRAFNMSIFSRLAHSCH